MKAVHSRVRTAVALVGLALCTQVLAADEKLKPVYFDTGSFKLSREAEKRLDAVIAHVKAHPNEPLTLVGSTDPRGTVQVNFQLRRQRVSTARQYLVDHGIADDKIETRMADQVEGIPVSEYSKLRRVAFEVGEHNVAEVEPKNAKPIKEPEEQKDAQGRPIVNVLYWKSVNHALYILAKEKGYFEEEGLHVNLRESQLEANDIAKEVNESDKVGKYILDAKELRNKKVFIGAVCAYGFHDALAKKLPVVEIGSMVANVNTVIMKKDLLAAVKKDLRVFKGHSVARVKNQPTDIDPAYLFLDKLSVLGLKQNVDYTVKWYDTWDASFEAVAKGDVDAAVSLPPIDVEFVEKHPDVGLLYVRELFPYMPCCRQVVTRENLRKYRDRYVHFMRAVIKAHKFYNEHPDDSTKILARFLGMREALVKQVLVSKGYALNPDPMFKGAQAFRKSMLSLGSKVGGDLRESVDTSLYEDALVSLQKENGSDPYYAKMIEAYRRAN